MICSVPLVRELGVLNPPVNILDEPTGIVTSNESDLLEEAVWAFVAEKDSDRFTVRISPTTVARLSVAKRPPFASE